MLLFLSFATESDKNKFSYIYEKYKRLLLKKSYEILGDSALAEDAVSEAFLRVYRNLHKVDNPDSPMTASFLVVIVKNVSLTMLKKNSKTVLEDIDEGEYKDSFSLEASVIDKENIKVVKLITEKLPNSLREPFLLYYGNDLPHKDIAAFLNINENAVGVRIHRAKKKIVEMLREEGWA